MLKTILNFDADLSVRDFDGEDVFDQLTHNINDRQIVKDILAEWSAASTLSRILKSTPSRKKM